MGSRLRNNPIHIFECWCEVVAPKDQDHPPWIIQKFPRTYEEKEVLKSVPQFTFPCYFEKSSVQHFSFVLTNVESKFLYGFCRHAPESESALVILSHLPWHELFYKILNHCSSLSSSTNSEDLWAFLHSLYQSVVPPPGSNLSISYGIEKVFNSACPNHLSLPSIPENRNLSEYYSAIDTANMMMIFASLLNERRVIVKSERVSRLSACVQAANALIYPMSWQHIFIPVLPEHLLDYLSAPMPFLIGVAQPLFQTVKLHEIGDVVILDADNNRVSTPFSDLDKLPPEVVSSLKKSLSTQNSLLGDAVARAFMRAIVHLIGNYREALQFRDDDRQITFNQEKFLTLRPPHFQPFITSLLHQQLFRQFVEERLNLLNSGLHTSDDFELEASVYGDRSPSKVKQIISNVKRESGAIMKNVKNKTNPAVKSAVKSVSKSSKNVREKGRITYKELRSKLKDAHQKNSSALKNNTGSISKPRSVPSSPTQINKSSGGLSNNVLHLGLSQNKKALRQSSLRPFSCDTESNSFRQPKWEYLIEDPAEKTPSPEEIDLISEMENVLNSQIGPIGNSSESVSSGECSDEEGTTGVVKNESSPDLLLMESPSDEIEFDPLAVKTIPTKNHGIIKTEKVDWSVKSSVPGNTDFLATGPRKLQPDRYFPFTGCNGLSSSFQSQSSVPSVSAANHFRPSPFLSSNIGSSFETDFSEKNKGAFTCQFSCDDNQLSKAKLTASAKSNLSNGNNCAFPNRSSYVTEGVNCNVENHLLGDFSSEFSKLSVVKNKNF